MKQNYVTLLVPAYNAEKLAHRLFDSILNQTYPYIDVIVINDGSTDNTLKTLTSYTTKFKEKGYKYTIINQTNVGVSGTINNGLKYIEGEYFAWPDIDDWYDSPESIEKLVRALKNNDDTIGVARCAYKRINEENMELLKISIPSHTEAPSYIFEDSVFFKEGVWIEPGGWMIKTKFLDKYIPNREIYTSPLTGQNTQLLWPILYHTKCISLSEPLFCYLIRKQSHSRALFSSFEKKIKQEEEYKETFVAVINSISDITNDDKKRYIQFFEQRKVINQMYWALNFKKRKEYITNYQYYKKLSGKTIEIQKTIAFYLSYLPLGLHIYFLSISILKSCMKFYNNLKSYMTKHKTCIFILLFLSILLNILIALSYLSPKIAKKTANYSFKSATYSNTEEFENILRNGTLKLLEDKYSVDESIIYSKNLRDFLRLGLGLTKKISIYEYGEYGYLLYYTFLYGKEKRDNLIIEKVKNKFDKGFFPNSYNIVRNDQIPWGCIAIELYKFTGDTRYKEFCDQLYSRLDSLDQTNGIILYHNKDLHQHVDGIGLVSPFLSLYAKTFQSKHAYEMLHKMVWNYIEYGVDFKTGLPAQAYHSVTKIKNFRTNWGRGTSWFLMGMDVCDSIPLSYKKTLLRTDSTLLKLGPVYTQYLGASVQSESKPDMSATVPILYHLTNQNKYNLSKKEFVSIIAPYTDKKGIIRFNSPTISLPEEKPNAFQSHHLTQGISLYLMSKLK